MNIVERMKALRESPSLGVSDEIEIAKLEAQLEQTLLSNATTEQMQAYASRLGYDFTPEDCEEVKRTRAPWNDGETMGEAIDDFLRAFEA